MYKLLITCTLSMLIGGNGAVCPAADFKLSTPEDIAAVHQLYGAYKSWREQIKESSRQITMLEEALENSGDEDAKDELLCELESVKRQVSGLRKNIKEGQRAAYGETRNLFPQFKSDLANPGLYDPSAYDPGSANMLAEARRLIAEIRYVNRAIYHADGSNAANPIEKRVWLETASAVENTGKTMALGLTNFFIRQEGKGRQKPEYLKNMEPALTIGPFLKRGKGGDVPEGDLTYIDFYSLKKPRDEQYASALY